ncbi:MAG: prepilin-type N-terminal cleavage/methylation domain-containing protein [candidate division NC10 bacterium]|nr:prepilin-type N-terminal cleavage/methylation domain-containing protein [candidate division NC10 bacterium]
MSFKDQKGFTLIELIVVLIILGLLAAVAIPKYVDLRTEAETQSAKATVAGARGGITLDFAQKKLSNLTYNFPDTGEDITTALQRVMEGLKNPPMDGFTWKYVTGSGNTMARVSATLTTSGGGTRTID